MKQTTKPTSKEVAAYLKEALQPFCEQMKGLRPALAEPFRQADHDGEDCVMASDSHVLICIRAKKAGCAVSPFRKMDDFDAHKPIPHIDFNHRLQARTVRRIDMELLLEQMEKHEQEHKQTAVADVLGVLLTIDGLSHLERAMAIFGAEDDYPTLFFQPGRSDDESLDNDDDDYDYQESEEEDRPLTAIPDDMRHTDRFPDAVDIVIPGTEQRVSNTEQCEQIMKWMQDTGHMPIAYVRLDDGVHVEVSDVYDRRIKAVIQEGKAIGADARRYTFDEGGDLWPIGSDICVRATCEETGRSDMYGLSFFV